MDDTDTTPVKIQAVMTQSDCHLKRRFPLDPGVTKWYRTPRKCPLPTTPTTQRLPLTALERFSDHARYMSLSCSSGPTTCRAFCS